MEDYGIKGVTDAEPCKEKLLNGPWLPDAAGKMEFDGPGEIGMLDWCAALNTTHTKNSLWEAMTSSTKSKQFLGDVFASAARRLHVHILYVRTP